MVKRDNKRVVAGGENLLLGESALDLVALDHFLFAQNCRRVSALAHSEVPGSGVRNNQYGVPFIA